MMNIKFKRVPKTNPVAAPTIKKPFSGLDRIKLAEASKPATLGSKPVTSGRPTSPAETAKPSFLKNLFTKKPSSPKPPETPKPTYSKPPKDPGLVAESAKIVKDQAKAAVKTWSLVLVVLGFVYFALIKDTGIGPFVSLALLFIGTFVFFDYIKSQGGLEKTLGGWVVIFVFLVWYFLFKSDLNSLFYILALLVFFAAVLGIATKGKGLKAIGAGLFPILIFFIDMGLIGWSFSELNWTITPFVQTLILFMPWWSLLGFFCLPSENFFVGFAKIIGIFYLIFILLSPYVPNLGHYQEGLPGLQELQKSEQAVREKYAGKENPFISNLVCAFTDPTDINLCVQKRQDDSELKYICKTTRKLTEGTDDYTRCLNEEREKKKKKMMVSGTIDSTIKQPTKVEFKTSEYFPQISYQPRQPYPILLNVENPREQQIRTQIRCFFKQNNKNITGYADPSEIFLSRTKEAKNIICTPSEDLNGTHILVFQADLNNLTTSSRLTRLFIGDINQKTREEINELKSTYVSGSNSLSRAPKEFAWINFGLGEPETNPIIQNDARPIFVSTIENGGGGRILSISGYYFDLEKSSISPEQSSDCFSGTGEKIRLPPVTGSYSFFSQTLPLTSCFVNIPYNLINPDQEFILKEFEASLYYSYRVEKETRVEVKRVESLLS